MLKFFVLSAIVSAIFALPAHKSISDDDRAEELEQEFQGDMIISQAELDAFNGRIDEALRWPGNVVPYWINMTYFGEFVPLLSLLFGF